MNKILQITLNKIRQEGSYKELLETLERIGFVNIFKLKRTSLQSFRFLPQNLCTAHSVRAGEITRTSLQSLLKVLGYAFYETKDCSFLGID
jgi:hypothetical protein